jgi:WD40 repeat protein
LNWYDNETVITASTDGLIRFWKIHSAEDPMQTLEVKADVRDMEFLTLEATGQEMLTVASGDRVYFFDLGDMKLLHDYPMPIHFKDVRTFMQLLFSSDLCRCLYFVRPD